MRYRLRTLLIVLALLVPINAFALLFVAAAVESSSLNLTVARGLFYATAIAFLIVLVAIPVAMICNGESHK
jgi:hypothetical protein